MNPNVGDSPFVSRLPSQENSNALNPNSHIDFPKSQDPASAPLAKGRLKRYPPVLNHDELKNLVDAFSKGDVKKGEEILKNRSLPSVLSWGRFTDVKDLARLALKNPKKVELLDLIVKNLDLHPTYEKFKYELLCFVIEENSIESVSFLIKSIPKDPPEGFKGKKALDLALERQFLSVGVALEKDFLDQEAFELSKVKDPSDLKRLIFLGFLNSSQAYTIALIAKLKGLLDDKYHAALSEAETFIHNEGSLIARFPETWKRNLMISSYNKDPLDIEKDVYTMMQMRFAEKRHAIFTEVLNELKEKNLGFISCYAKLMQPRPGEKSGQYLQLRHKNPSIDGRVTTPIIDRYIDFMNLAGEVYNHSTDPSLVRSTSKVHYAPENREIASLSYTINGNLRNGKTIPLTTVHLLSKTTGVWEHTSIAYLDELEKEQEVLFEEIKHEKSFHELKRKAAYFYYLGIHAMYSFRGNSQNMLELHKMCYEMHGIQVPPPNQTFVLPDCVALCLPFDTFFKEYYDKVFESPITS